MGGLGWRAAFDGILWFAYRGEEVRYSRDPFVIARGILFTVTDKGIERIG